MKKKNPNQASWTYIICTNSCSNITIPSWRSHSREKFCTWECLKWVARIQMEQDSYISDINHRLMLYILYITLIYSTWWVMTLHLIHTLNSIGILFTKAILLIISTLVVKSDFSLRTLLPIFNYVRWAIHIRWRHADYGAQIYIKTNARN